MDKLTEIVGCETKEQTIRKTERRRRTRRRKKDRGGTDECSEQGREARRTAN